MKTVKIPFLCITGDHDNHVTFKNDIDAMRLGVELSKRKYVYKGLLAGKREQLVLANADHMSFAGENPDALDAAGISVRKVRYLAVSFAGLLAGWGGASLSIFLASGYSRNMVAGRGFMALAALILGKWRAPYAVLACLFFGLMEALQIRMQGMNWGGIPVPAQFVQMVPYLATIFVLAGFVGQARPPKKIGRIFE